MTTYSLNISIDPKALNTIYAADQFVTLVKSVGPALAGNVAWISFQPLESNVVSWQENYYIYGTTTALQAGAQIVMTSQTDSAVQDGWTYSFKNGQFTGIPGKPTGAFMTANNQVNGLNFGLAQAAIINGASTLAPLNAVPVNFNESASFTPIETVSIYLSSYSDNGVVISQVSSSALAIQLTSANASANVGFNDATNSFFLGAPSAALTQADVALRAGHRSRRPAAVAG